MKSLGPNFQKLRKEQNITLADAAKDICSTSNLSRWENGKIQISFDNVLKLINRIHLTPNEFISNAEIDNDEHISLEMRQVINDEDTDKMKQLIEEYLDLYHQKKRFYELYLAVILCNQYLIIKNKNLLPFPDQMRLYTHLSQIKVWSTFNLSFFGNCVFMIKSDRVFSIAMQILNNQKLVLEDSTHYNLGNMMGVLSDATLSLIFRKDLKHAKKLLAALDQVDLPQVFSFFKMTIAFMKRIVNYMENDNENYVLEFIQNTMSMGMDEAADTFLDIFKRARDIKHSK